MPSKPSSDNVDSTTSRWVGPGVQSQRSSNNETHNSFGGPAVAGSTKKRCQAPAATATSRQSRRRASSYNTKSTFSEFLGSCSPRSLLLTRFDRIEIAKYNTYKNHEIFSCTRVTGNVKYKDLESFEARASSPLGCSWANKTIRFCTKPHFKEIQRKGHWSSKNWATSRSGQLLQLPDFSIRDSKNSAASPRVFETKIYITEDRDSTEALLKVWSPPAVARSQQSEGEQNSPPPNYLQGGNFQQNEVKTHELFHIISSMNHLHIIFIHFPHLKTVF